MFSPSRWSKDGLHNQCAACGKAYRDTNKERIRAKNKAKYEAIKADPVKHAAYLQKTKNNTQRLFSSDPKRARAKSREAMQRRREKEKTSDPEGFRLKVSTTNKANYRKRVEADPEYLKRCSERTNQNYWKLRAEKGVEFLSAQRRERRLKLKQRDPERLRKRARNEYLRRRESNEEQFLAWHRAYKIRKYATDPNFKLAKAMRRMVHTIVRGRGGLTLLPYTPAELRTHLEMQWRDGMTWANWGTMWQIDHIKPVSLFLKEGETDPAVVNALVNLQPLTVEENRTKADIYYQ